jgi:hypothetical protein
LNIPGRYRKKSNMELYHPGTCTATQWGRRYGKYTEAQRFDDAGHRWSLAKDKNWGPWSCCGNTANSPGCKERVNTHSSDANSSIISGVGERIRFLEKGNTVIVTRDEGHIWRLEDGRIAKKRTHGKVWVWMDENKFYLNKNEERSTTSDANSSSTTIIKTGVGERIRFLEKGNTVIVTRDEGHIWRLEGGRIAKKSSHGKVWVWMDEYNLCKEVGIDKESDPEGYQCMGSGHEGLESEHEGVEEENEGIGRKG